MPGRKATVRSRLIFSRESVRQRLSMKAVGLFMVLNLLVVIFLGSFLLLHFEKNVNPKVDTYGDALWLTFVTISTVGYGDSYPVTAGGRMTIIMEILVGVSLLTAYFGVRSVNKRQQAERKAKGMDSNVKVQDHFLVCGWNQRALYALERLKSELEPSKTPVVLLCDLEVNPCEDDYTFFIRGSVANEGDLKRANVEKAEAVILLADESKGGDEGDIDARTVLAALNIRSLNPGIKMTAEILQPGNKHHLELAGVGEIYDANMMGGNLLAQSAVHYGVIGVVAEIVTKKTEERVYKLKATEQMATMTVEQLVRYLESELGARLMAVSQEDQMRLLSDRVTISAGDIMLVISEREPPGAL
jgi:voltage-gated potassium channel